MSEPMWMSGHGSASEDYDDDTIEDPDRLHDERGEE
jgi:hypothetical protein